MNKDKLIKQRAKYVQDRINKAARAENEIKRLAAELFLSQDTIRRDLKRQV